MQIYGGKIYKKMPFPIRCNKREKVKREMQNKYKEETAKPCPNTILSRKGTIISNETDEERTCLLGSGAGRSSDRSSYRGIDRAKGVILPLDLGAYRFCLHGG